MCPNVVANPTIQGRIILVRASDNTDRQDPAFGTSPPCVLRRALRSAVALPVVPRGPTVPLVGAVPARHADRAAGRHRRAGDDAGAFPAVPHAAADRAARLAGAPDVHGRPRASRWPRAWPAGCCSATTPPTCRSAGAFLAGLIAGPYAGAIVGGMVGLPALAGGEWIAVPFIVGCGFAGGGLREICPKDAIWHFSPFVFTDLLPLRSGNSCGGFEVDWQILLIAAPIALELLRQVLGHRYGMRPAVLLPGDDSPGMLALTLLATDADRRHPDQDLEPRPHRAQAAGAGGAAARRRASRRSTSQINPHFLFNTLTSISSLIRTQPDTARMLIIGSRACCAGCCAARTTSSPLRDELSAVDEYLDIECVRFGPPLRVDKDIDAGHARPGRAEHDPAAAGRELDQARPGRQARRTAASRCARCARGSMTVLEVDRQRRRHRRRPRPAGRPSSGIGLAQRDRAPAGHLRRRRDGWPSRSAPGRGHAGPPGDSRPPAARAAVGVT